MTDSHEQSGQDSFPLSSSSEQYDNQYSYDYGADLSDDMLYSKTLDTLEETQSFELRDSLLLEGGLLLLEGGLGDSGPEFSVTPEVQVDKRPDILKAREAPRRIQNCLFFKGETELAEKKESVKLDEVLEEDFHVQQEKLRQVEAETSEDDDAIPKHVLESMERIKTVSEANATSTFRACTILETAMPAFEYGRKAVQDRFILRGASKGALDAFDTAFRNVLKLRGDGNVEEASEKLHKDCYRFLEAAVREAKDDRSSHQTRCAEEDSILTTDGVASLRRDTEVAILEGRESYRLIVQKCNDDLDIIDEYSVKLRSDMEQAKSTYIQEKVDREGQLVANRKRQQELRKELEDLLAKEKLLVETNVKEKKLQEIANEDNENAQETISKWRGEISTLCKQAEVSLVIMDEVAECTHKILKDTEKHKQRWTKDLELMKVESLLHLRDALIAKGCVHKMESDDSKNNITITIQEIEENKEKLRKLAQHNFTEMVQKRREEIKSLQEIQKRYEACQKTHDGIVKGIKAELAEVDKELKKLRHSLRLDSFEDRYQSFQRARSRIFRGDVDDIPFCSHGNYGHS